MKPSKLYKNDYTSLTDNGKEEKRKYCSAKEEVDILTTINYSDLSREVRPNLSLFPNNLIVLSDLKEDCDLVALNKEFENIIHRDKALEREVLNFINNTPAYHIVGGILMDRFQFGHHECYLFKEMGLGNEYRTDYVLVGKGSGGYEFVLIEFEKPDGRITLKDGHWGECFRKGTFQVKDWKRWMDAHNQQFFSDLLSVSGKENIPNEFNDYDSTRFHYVVVSGLRSDFNDTTYRDARESARNDGIYMLHHDNLLDNARKLFERQTF